MTELDARLSGLASLLHPLDSSPDSLPVQGYCPPGGDWQPRPAAVLIPLVLKPEPHLVLTVRTRELRQHAGQVSLPGGSIHAGESFPVATALREAREEIGLEPERVQLLGLLDCFDTITGYRISPVVGWIDGPVEWRACPLEVAEIFSLPLDQVFDSSSYRRHEIQRAGRVHEAWSMKSGCRPIWGATAAILRALSRY